MLILPLSFFFSSQFYVSSRYNELIFFSRLKTIIKFLKYTQLRVFPIWLETISLEIVIFKPLYVLILIPIKSIFLSLICLRYGSPSQDNFFLFHNLFLCYGKKAKCTIASFFFCPSVFVLKSEKMNLPVYFPLKLKEVLDFKFLPI